MVGARIPHSWKSQLQVLCQEAGKSESELVQEAIAAYLGKTDVDSLTSMQKRLGALERQYKKLATLVTN